MITRKKAWAALLFTIFVLFSGLAFLPLFTLSTQSRFTWENFAMVYQLFEKLFVPLVLR